MTTAPWVLFIEDASDEAEWYSEQLHRAGLNVATANEGRQGWEKARQLSPEVIVLDLRLPDMDGWEVCLRLRSDPRTAAIPIILLSGLSGPDIADRSRAERVVYLRKPCPPEVLEREVKRALARSAT